MPRCSNKSRPPQRPHNLKLRHPSRTSLTTASRIRRTVKAKSSSMPRSAPRPTDSRRITRSMTRAKPFEDIVNTAPSSGAVPAPDSSSKTRRLRPEEAPVSESQAMTAAPETPRVIIYKAGDRVQVYMRRDGEYTWCSGKVPNLRSFRVRTSGTGSKLYPVLLDQRRPRIVRWFDEGQGQIRPHA
ncbi:hypothetical protein BC628DRAFT_269445 [Trametes gibbosa]|nr:hypothetical protein BC628DRAFT_269445 [Trametes gibbosa]